MSREMQYSTLKDVAKRAGTTAATASYVLNGASNGRYISDEMRMRVEEAARELHYVKSSAASSLRGKKRKIIAVLIPQFYNQFFIQMVLRIEEVADRYGFILSTCNTFDDPEREAEILTRMQAQRVDGYIIIPTAQAYRNTQQIREMQIPMVIVDRTLDGAQEPYCSVLSQNYESVALAAEQLFQAGHTRIGYIGWDADYGGLEQREIAFNAAMDAHGIPKEQRVIYAGALTEESGIEMTCRLLDEHPEVTAILYSCNIQARGGVNVLVSRGVIPGKQISVAMVGVPNWARTGQNDLTCVDLQGEALGQAAAELLFRIINEDLSKGTMEPQIVACKLVTGNSIKRINQLELLKKPD